MLQRKMGYTLLLATLACSGAVETRPSSTAESVAGSEALAKQRIALSTGISMAYLEAGDPRGEVVLLLHGYTDTGRSWYPAMQHLTALRPDLRLFALDLRGHGRSSMPAAPACRHTPEACFRSVDFAADVLAFMDALGVTRAAVVGHSMGSVVAQELALTHPARIASIVLVATTSSGVGNVALRDYVLAEPLEGSWKKALEAQRLTFPDGVYDLTPLDADPKAEAWMAANWVVDPVAPPAFIAAIVQETARIKLGAWIGAARALLHTDNTARLKALRVPALVIWATQDGIFLRSPDQSGLLAALDVAAAQCRTTYTWKQYGIRPLPASGLQVDDIGHNVPWGAPKEVATDIAQFLRTGLPTTNRYAAKALTPHLIDAVPDQAVLVNGPAAKCSR